MTTASRPSRWSVPFLGFGIFAVGTCAFVLAGVLPDLGRTFDLSVETAGQVVTVFGPTVVIVTPILATLSARWERRPVLLMAIAIYLLGCLGTALSPSFALVLTGQMVAAAGAGLLIPTAAVTAASLVEGSRRGRAIAVVTAGLTAATALGAPIGTVISQLFGWRATMWFVCAIAVVGAIGLRALIPAHVDAPAAEGIRDRLRPLAGGRVVTLLLTTVVGVIFLLTPFVVGTMALTVVVAVLFGASCSASPPRSSIA